MNASASQIYPHTVLIVDDVAAVRESLRYALEEADDLVVIGEAGDGIEAVERVAALAPQVVILDIHLPKMDGLEVARQLKARAHPPIIIFLTGRSKVQLHQQAHQVGGDGLVSKSEGWNVLLAEVRQALARG